MGILAVAALAVLTLLSAAGQAAAITAPAALLARHQTIVSFTFDDGDADQMTAARILEAYRLEGTFYIIAGAVGTAGYVTGDDLRRLAAAGDEIGGHTVSHLSLPLVAPAEARRQICDGRQILTGWGYQVRSFAYPDATYNAAVEAAVRGCGFASGRIGDAVPPRNFRGEAMNKNSYT